jgi:tetratricopeptide (TPR) repeat protein
MAVRINNPGLLGAFYSGMSRCEWSFGSFDQACQTATKAVDLCEAVGNAKDAGEAYLIWQWSRLYTGDYDQVLTLKEKVLCKMEQQFHLRWYVWAFAGASLACSWLGHWEQAVAEAQEELRVAQEFADNSLIAFAAWNLSFAYACKGDMARALEYGELAVQNAPTPADLAWAQAALACAWCRAGEPRRGVEILAALIPIFRGGRFVPAEPFTPFLGEGYWLAGEPDKARQTLEELLEIAAQCGMRFLIGSVHRLLGEIALPTNPTQAASHFERSIATLREINAENELAMAYAGYGRLHTQQGHIAQARDYLTRALAIFERLGTLGKPDKVRQALAALPEG